MFSITDNERLRVFVIPSPSKNKHNVVIADDNVSSEFSFAKKSLR